MSETTPSVTPTHVTPLNTLHALFGKVLTVIRQDAEFIVAEIKDEIHSIEAKFKRSEVAAAPVSVAAPAPAEAAPTAPASSVTA